MDTSNNGPLTRILYSTLANESEFTVKTNLTESSISKDVDSPWESVIIAATVSLVGMILLAVLYWLHHFCKRKRQTMVMPVITPSGFISDYFTRPREPVVFYNEVSGHALIQETVTYWHRPLQPVTTDTDLYPVVL